MSKKLIIQIITVALAVAVIGIIKDVISFKIIDKMVTKTDINSLLPTDAEIYRLDNDLIMYEPTEAVRILQRALVGEGYQLNVDSVMGHDTYKAIIDYQRKERVMK